MGGHGAYNEKKDIKRTESMGASEGQIEGEREREREEQEEEGENEETKGTYKHERERGMVVYRHY